MIAFATLSPQRPNPACVGSSSPLLPSIQHARSQFDARYTPTGSFQTANVPVVVTGVGFFDFLHGQTGVAPNGIELHAVLDVQFGTGGTPTTPPTTIPTPASTETPPTNLIPNGGFETSGSWTYAGQTLPPSRLKGRIVFPAEQRHLLRQRLTHLQTLMTAAS